MKKISILLIALFAILGLAWYKGKERNSRLNRNLTTVKLREWLFPNFDVNGIKKIRIKEEKSEATLVVQNDTWVVQERSGYPLDKEKLQTALLSLKYEKIKAGRRIGKDSWGKINVNTPDAGYGIGTLVEMYDEKGELKYSLVLGGKVNSSGGSSGEQMNMFGGGSSGSRFVRVVGEDTIWEIGEQLPDLVTKPESWISKSFIDVQELKSVTVSLAKPEDSWTAVRAEENGDFTLVDAKPGEKVDPGKATLGTLLSNASFTDVLAKDKVAAVMKDATKVKLVTFQGFTYDLQVAKQAGKTGTPDKYFLSVNVSSVFPKQRPEVKDEKPEEKKANDESFAAMKKTLSEKLANEQKLAGWVFEVSEYSVSSLLKKRSEILAPPAEKTDAPVSGNGKPAGLPDVKKMIPGFLPGTTSPNPTSVTTPPVSVSTPPTQLPQAPKVELKPAPSPDAPVPGVKPVEPAKPAAEPAKPAAAPAK